MPDTHLFAGAFIGLIRAEGLSQWPPPFFCPTAFASVSGKEFLSPLYMHSEKYKAMDFKKMLRYGMGIMEKMQQIK